IFQKLYGLFAGIRVHVNCGHLLPSLRGTWFFSFEILREQEIKNIMKVIDLVHSRVDAIISRHSLRNMACDRHTQFVGLFANGLNVIGGHRAVDLQLLKTGIVIVLHPGMRVRSGVHTVNAERDWTIAIYYSGKHHPRANSVAVVEGVTDCGDELELIADITDSRHTCR